MRIRTITLMTAAVAAAATASSISCTTIDCGEGTVEEDGVCVPGEGATPATCGEGTRLENGQCVPGPRIECGDGTQPQMDANGDITCVGTGGSRAMCTTELLCPTPATNKLTMCGRIYDTESDLPIEATDHTGQPCGMGGSTSPGSPCLLQMKFYDAVDFASNPTGAAAITPASFELDDCGRYIAQNLNKPALNFIGIGVDDAPTASDLHKLTGVATANAVAAPARNFRAYVTKNTTDAAWTTSSAIGGQAFSQRGVLAAVFRYRGTPVPGVRIRRSGNFIPNDDFYFSNAGIARTTVSPNVVGDTSAGVGSTGPNGTALVINVATATEHDGAGAEPSGCRWPVALAAAIPGVVFVQLKDAETTGGTPCL